MLQEIQVDRLLFVGENLGWLQNLSTSYLVTNTRKKKKHTLCLSPPATDRTTKIGYHEFNMAIVPFPHSSHFQQFRAPKRSFTSQNQTIKLSMGLPPLAFMCVLQRARCVDEDKLIHGKWRPCEMKHKPLPSPFHFRDLHPIQRGHGILFRFHCLSRFSIVLVRSKTSKYAYHVHITIVPQCLCTYCNDIFAIAPLQRTGSLFIATDFSHQNGHVDAASFLLKTKAKDIILDVKRNKWVCIDIFVSTALVAKVFDCIVFTNSWSKFFSFPPSSGACYHRPLLSGHSITTIQKWFIRSSYFRFDDDGDRWRWRERW